MGGTAGPSHVNVRNGCPGQTRGKAIERSGVVARSSGVAVLNGDGPRPWLVAWDGRSWALWEQMEGCLEKAEQRYRESESVLRNWFSDISLYQSFSEYLLAPITSSPFPIPTVFTHPLFSLSGLHIS